MFGIFSKKFHKQTDFYFELGTLPGNPQYWPKEWKEINYKAYPRLSKIDLPRNLLSLGSFEEALKNRRSTRVFDNRVELSLRELATLIYFSAGVRPQNIKSNENLIRRFYPSGGALYPLEAYLGIQKVKGIEPGIYHYNVKDHLLEQLLKKEGIDDFKQALLYPWSREAAVFFIVTAVWDRNFMKYKDRGYRMISMEAGHLTQNLALTAAALKIGCCNLVGFHNKRVNEILDVDKEDEEDSLYVSALGK